MNYPPFCDIIVAVFSGKDENAVKIMAKDFFVDVKEIIEAYAPAPAPISKVNGEYRWRVLMKELLTDEKIEKLGMYVEKYLMLKSDVKISIDVNPNNMS